MPVDRRPSLEPSPTAAKSASSGLGEDDAFVLVDSVAVPRFSKMVKNMGLSLFDQRQATSRPTLPTDPRGNSGASRPSPSNRPSPASRPRPRLTVTTDDAPITPAAPLAASSPAVVQGFRVVGDQTNRIIFLNLADLGLSPGAPSLRLGNQELVPIDGLLSAADSSPLSSPPRSEAGSPVGSLFERREPTVADRPRTSRLHDAVDKMAKTQQRGKLLQISFLKIFSKILYDSNILTLLTSSFLTAQDICLRNKVQMLFPVSGSRPFPTSESRLFPAFVNQLFPISGNQIFPALGNQLFPASVNQLFPASVNRLFPTSGNQIFTALGNQLFPASVNQLFPASGNRLFPASESRLLPASRGHLFPASDIRLPVSEGPRHVTSQKQPL